MRNLSSTIIVIVVLVVIVVSLIQNVYSDPYPFSAAEQDYIVSEHNRVRLLIVQGRVVGQPKASNMGKMSWMPISVNLNNTLENRQYSECYYGENIWGTSALDKTAKNVTAPWFEEYHDYDFHTQECKPGKMCGHYTQVVWADSIKVGCGRALCPSGQLKTIIFCNYCPGGNWMGEDPYKQGTSYGLI